MTKEKRILNEIDRLDDLFQDLDINTRKSIDGLIKRAAYMRIQLEVMEDDLLKNGYVEMFTQSASAPPYERERPIAKQYNTLNKNYQTIMKLLINELPEALPEGAGAEIMSFVNGAR